MPWGPYTMACQFDMSMLCSMQQFGNYRVQRGRSNWLVQSIPTPYNPSDWATLVQHALSHTEPIPVDQLLLVRDTNNQVFRPLEPPQGVTPRAGAVLVLLYPDGHDLRLLLTVRSDRMNHHRGEVALPGGASDANDHDVVATALRECREELGIQPQITIWGLLSTIYIAPSNFRITPVVGFVEHLPALNPNNAEVSEVFTISLQELLNPDTVRIEPWTLRGHEVLVPFFAIGGHKVWGATALILSELRARMRSSLPNS